MGAEVPAANVAALVGSTASGKSDVALEIAKETGASILSCDSLLVYKKLDIGTAKPSAEELAAVPHYGIDLVEPDAIFNAGDYQRYAKQVVDEHVAKGKPLLIVGGTGFYLKALLFGVWKTPATQPEIRERLHQRAKKAVQEAGKDVSDEKLLSQFLYAELVVKDPEYAEEIEANDYYRVLRALEIIEVSGKPLSQTLKETKQEGGLDFTVPVFGIQRSKVELEKRIVARTDAMFSAGIVNEVKQLKAAYPETLKSLGSVGYKEVLDFLNGKMTLPECRERIVISTRQLAKKQMTFLRTFPQAIQWFDLPKAEAELKQAIKKSF